MNTEIPNQQYNNLTNVKRETLYNPKNDHSIVIKEANKCSAVVIWVREDYTKEAEKQLQEEEVYEEFDENPSYLETIIMKALCKTKKRGDISNKTLGYFLVSDPKTASFYLLPKIHNKLYDVSGRPVSSNCKYYTENICFLGFSYISL